MNRLTGLDTSFLASRFAHSFLFATQAPFSEGYAVLESAGLGFSLSRSQRSGLIFTESLGIEIDWGYQRNCAGAFFHAGA
jgi:hypothetical protein